MFWNILPLTLQASYYWNIGAGALPPSQISGSALAPKLALSYTSPIYVRTVTSRVHV